MEIRTDSDATASMRRLDARVVKAPPWGALVTADLFLSALAAGLFVVSTIGDIFKPAVYGDAATIAYLIALPVAVADLVCLVLDLGDPRRFHHMLRMMKPRSPMSAGVWGLSAMATVIGLNMLLSVLMLAGFGGAHLARRIAGGIGLVPAIFAGAYKGVLLSSTAQPRWKDARWLGAQLSVSSMALGSAAMLLTALLFPAPAAVKGFRLLLIVLLALELLLSTAVFSELDGQRSIKVRSVGALVDYVIGFRPGIVASLALAAVSPSVLSLSAASILTLIDSLAFRHHLVMIPHRAN